MQNLQRPIGATNRWRAIRPNKGQDPITPMESKTMSDSTRSRILEVMAMAICGKNCDAPRCSCQTNKTTQRACWEISLRGAEAALTAYESHLSAEGMAVVPVAYTPEMFMAGDQQYDEGYGVPEIWAAMLSASPYGKASMQEDEQARLDGLAPISTDTKDTTK